jgi:hypothetical protein
MLLVFGIYTIVSWGIKTYTILEEENMSPEIFIVTDNNSSRDISEALLVQWLDGLKKRKYVCNVNHYIIHKIVVEEEHERYFIFSTTYSVTSTDMEGCWKNARHYTEHDGLITIKSKFFVNKVGNRYNLRGWD